MKNLITLRGGRQMARWQYLVGTCLYGLSAILVIAHKTTISTVAGAFGFVLGVLLLVWGRDPVRRQKSGDEIDA